MGDSATTPSRVFGASLARQLTSFVGVGLISTSLHYAILILLVQIAKAPPVPAALCGFTVGGVLSYALNRRHTFASERPHGEAAWRFALVAGVGFVLTYLAMRLLVETWRIPYLPAQMVTTGFVMIWTFTANRLWTFGTRGRSRPGPAGDGHSLE